MSNNILVGYASRYGSTQEVAEVIAETLKAAGVTVDIQPLRSVRTVSLYDAVVIGAPLFMYHWHKDAINFLTRNKKELIERPVGVFVLGPTHDPYDEQEWEDSHSQIDKDLKKLSWFRPIAIEMFGGKFDPEKLRFPLNKLAGAEPASDIRDWTAIRNWAQSLVPLLMS